MSDDVAKLIAEIIFDAQTGDIDKVQKKLKDLEKQSEETGKKLSTFQQKQVRELNEFVKSETQAARRVKDLTAELAKQKQVGGDKARIEKLQRELDLAVKYEQAMKSVNAQRLKAITPRGPKQKWVDIAPDVKVDKKTLMKEVEEAKRELKDAMDAMDWDRVLFPRGFETKSQDIAGLVGDIKSHGRIIREAAIAQKQRDEAVRAGAASIDQEAFFQSDEYYDVPETSKGDVGAAESGFTQKEYDARYGDKYRNGVDRVTKKQLEDAEKEGRFQETVVTGSDYGGHEVSDDRITEPTWQRPVADKSTVENMLMTEAGKYTWMKKRFEEGKFRKKVIDRQADYVSYLQAKLKDFDEPGYLENWLEERRQKRKERQEREKQFAESVRGKEREKARVALSKIKSSEAQEYKKKRGLTTQWDVPQEKLETRARDAFIQARIQEADYQRYLNHEKRVSENIQINKQIQDVIGMPGPGNLEGLPAEKLKEKKRQEMMMKLPFNDPNYKFTIPNRPPPVTKAQLEAEEKAAQEEPKKSKYIPIPIKQVKPRPPKDVEPEVMEDIDRVIDDAIAELSIDAIDDAISQPVVRPEKKKVKGVMKEASKTTSPGVSLPHQVVPSGSDAKKKAGPFLDREVLRSVLDIKEPGSMMEGHIDQVVMDAIESIVAPIVAEDREIRKARGETRLADFTEKIAPISELAASTSDEIVEEVSQSIAEELGSMDISQEAMKDIDKKVIEAKGVYHSEPPENKKSAEAWVRPITQQNRQKIMEADFNKLLAEAQVELEKAKDRQRRGVGGQYAVQKAQYRIANISKALQAIKKGQSVWLDDQFVSPYMYDPDILAKAQDRDKFDPRPAQERKERIGRLPDDLRLLAGQKKINIGQAEKIAAKRIEAELKKPVQEATSKINEIVSRVGKVLGNIFSEQIVTMTGEFDTEEDMEEWISKLQEFGGVSGISRREKDVKMRTPEGPVTQRRHVGTVTLQKTTEELLKQRDALKLVNQAVVENGKAYTTSSKVAGKYTAGLAQGFNKVGNQFRALSWKFTLMSMGALGVFFSMMSFATLLRQAFGALITPLSNIDKLFQQVGLSVGLADLSKVKLNGEEPVLDENGNPVMEPVLDDAGNPVLDDAGNPVMQPVMQEGQSPADMLLYNTDDAISAWATINYIIGQVTAALALLGIELLNDPEFVDALQEGLQGLIDALKSPEVKDAIKSLATSFAELLPELVELVPWVAQFFQILVTDFPIIGPLLPWLVKLALAAAVLMPIFSALSMIAGIVGIVFQSCGWILTTLLIPALEVLAVALGVTVGAAAAIVVAILAIIVVVIIVIDYFGYLDDVVNFLIATFQMFLDILSAVFNKIADIAQGLSDLPFIGGFFQASADWNRGLAGGASGLADWAEGLKWQDKNTGETPFARASQSQPSTTNNVNVTQYIEGSGDAEKTADLANQKLMDALNSGV
jgi:hypothetical protein